MKKSRRILFRAAALVIIVAVAAVMFIIGRAHTIYFDNMDGEYQGKVYEPYYKVGVTVDDESASKLMADERGMASIMGQKLVMTLEITDEKGATPHSHKVSMPVPYNMDGIIINIPMLMAGLSPDAYMSEFVPAVPDSEEDEEVIIDEFDMSTGE